jgi:hypothetical protein
MPSARGRLALRLAVALAAACLLLSGLEACHPGSARDSASEFAGSAALDFTEETLQEEGGWDRADSPERWVIAATSDAELEAILAGTATVPPLPAGTTALLFYVGGRSPSFMPYEVTGIYGDTEEWTLAVRKNPTDEVLLAVYQSSRYLVFVDAPAPKTVKLRFEDHTVEGEPEVTWW